MNSFNNYINGSKEPSQRAGFGVTEMIVAMLLLGLMVSYIFPLMSNLNRMQKRINKQTLMQQTVMNLVEELHTFSAEQLQDRDAIQKQLEQQIDTQKYELVLDHHLAKKAGQPMRIDLELRSRHEIKLLPAAKLSTWLSFPVSVKEAS